MPAIDNSSASATFFRRSNRHEVLRQEVDPEHKLKAARPDDAVVLYVASHGYADSNGTFYLMPYDTGPPGATWGITEDVLNEFSSGEFSLCHPQELLKHWLQNRKRRQTH